LFYEGQKTLFYQQVWNKASFSSTGQRKRVFLLYLYFAEESIKIYAEDFITPPAFEKR